MKKRILPLKNSHGDTIVEVLIVLAILGLAFTMSYAIARRSLAQARSSQEHSEAQSILTNQIELIRAAIDKKTDVFIASPFCMTGVTTLDSSFGGGYSSVPASSTADDFSKYPAACQRNNLYYTSITYDSTTGIFNVRVRWEGIANLERQQAQITYRVYPLSTSVDSGIPLSGSAPQVKVRVSKIAPDTLAAPNKGEATPSCAKVATQSRAGTSVTLKQTNGTSPDKTQTTDGTSITTFTGVVENGTYTATATAPSVSPGSYQVCAPNPGGPVQPTAANPTPQIDMKIRPICWSELRHDYMGYYGDYLGYYGDYLGYYSDYLGYYGDPYTVYWFEHTGPDGRHAEWNKSTSPYSTQPNTFQQYEGGVLVEYRRVGSAYSSSGPFYERWEQRAGTAYTAPYDHYSAPYNHYTAPYDHYTAPYDHYGPWYTFGICPS
jgi:Tfp pilus assembly protein PilV